MYIYTYKYLRLSMCMYIHIHLHILIHVFIYACTLAYIYTHPYAYTHTCVHKDVPCSTLVWRSFGPSRYASSQAAEQALGTCREPLGRPHSESFMLSALKVLEGLL